MPGMVVQAGEGEVAMGQTWGCACRLQGGWDGSLVGSLSHPRPESGSVL